VIYPNIEFVLTLVLKFVPSDPLFNERGSYTEEIISLFSFFYKLKFA
jgi:hypothetical protein